MATKSAVVKVSPATLKRVKEIKKLSGLAVTTLADLGLDFFYAAVKTGEVVIQNGQIVPAAGAGR